MADTTKTPGKTLWTDSSGASSFSSVEAPPNLADVIEEVGSTAKEQAAERVRPYQTPVTDETLRTVTK